MGVLLRPVLVVLAGDLVGHVEHLHGERKKGAYIKGVQGCTNGREGTAKRCLREMSKAMLRT